MQANIHMPRNTQHLIPGRYEVELYRKIVAQYDRRGILNTANLRSANYATRRLNDRALHQRVPASELIYPAEQS